MKLLNNYLSAVAMTATSEAILLGVKYKIDMKTILDVLTLFTIYIHNILSPEATALKPPIWKWDDSKWGNLKCPVCHVLNFIG